MTRVGKTSDYSLSEWLSCFERPRRGRQLARQPEMGLTLRYNCRAAWENSG